MRDFLNTLSGKVIAILTIIALVFGVVAEGVSIYRNGEEAKTATETANNAAKLKLAEAEERAQLAKKAAFEAEAAKAVAENAAKLRLAEAERMAAEAKKAVADAETARETANNAAKLKLAEAEEKTQLAKKAAAEAETQKAVAENSAERQRAEREDAKAKARGDTADAQVKEWMAEKITRGGAVDAVRSLEGAGNIVDPFAPGPRANDIMQLGPKCRAAWTEWQGYTSHGAFAVTNRNGCSYNGGNSGDTNVAGSTAEAVAALKDHCNQKRWACTIVATK